MSELDHSREKRTMKVSRQGRGSDDQLGRTRKDIAGADTRSCAGRGVGLGLGLGTGVEISQGRERRDIASAWKREVQLGRTKPMGGNWCLRGSRVDERRLLLDHNVRDGGGIGKAAEANKATGSGG